ncbi:hypothetical protein IW262DRAFT_1462335 [Armillaria fumosa]|nr:hypothetical protein IW262DRAFT_1462335 [Armillaria fumosa]
MGGCLGEGLLHFVGSLTDTEEPTRSLRGSVHVFTQGSSLGDTETTARGVIESNSNKYSEDGIRRNEQDVEEHGRTRLKERSVQKRVDLGHGRVERVEGMCEGRSARRRDSARRDFCGRTCAGGRDVDGSSLSLA